MKTKLRRNNIFTSLKIEWMYFKIWMMFFWDSLGLSRHPDPKSHGSVADDDSKKEEY
jgi:hypothetical protein